MMGSTTMPFPPHQDGMGSPTMLRMGSGTPPMMGGDRDGRHRERMGTGSPMMMPPVMMGSSSCRNFARGLKFGTRGDDVKELQEMLHEGGFLEASSTGFFGKMTKEAVVKFQKEGGLNPSGFFGELSRKHHQKRCGEGIGHSENKKQEGDDRHPLMGSSTMPVPCMVGASANGCEHSNAFPPCLGMFSTSTGQPCPKPGRQGDDHDDKRGSTTPPVMPPPATTTASTTGS